MGEQTINSEDISAGSLFHDFYLVPDYQREYVWDSEEVEQLLQDIHAERGSADAAPEYFIGSIVVCANAQRVFELIDGQQRMTTLFLMLCAIRDHLAAEPGGAPGGIATQIAHTTIDDRGRDVHRYRLALQYPDSGSVLTGLAAGAEPVELPPGATPSMRNLLTAYQCVREFLRRELGGDSNGVRRFYAYLCNNVKLIRIKAKDVAKALQIFETINDRGVGLDAMDLLKNLLFMSSGSEEFARLKDTWKELQDTLHAAPEKPLRFLRYYILSQYDVTVIREDEIYVFFAKNAEQCGYKREPLAFAKGLLSAALAYKHFLRGNDAHGNPSWQLADLRYLGGRAARQHLILLLAGRGLAPELFQMLCREVEDLFFCYVVTRKPTRDFERSFAAWAAQLRKVTTRAQLEEVLATTFAKEKELLAPRFMKALETLAADDLQAYRLRYVLAKLTQYIELLAYGEGTAQRRLESYLEHQIEHVYPQTPSSDAESEFGPRRDPRVAQRLGNLLLIESSINASIGNHPYSKKREVYPKSRLLLTRALAERVQVGTATKIDRAVAALEPFATWDEAAVERRQQQLARLACQVWGVPLGEAATGADKFSSTRERGG